MAARWTLGVDNAIVEINAPETPIMDGSAKAYAEAILATGLEEQNAPRQYYEVREKTTFDYPVKGSSFII